jgi:hypothetical protein
MAQPRQRAGAMFGLHVFKERAETRSPAEQQRPQR